MSTAEIHPIFHRHESDVHERYPARDMLPFQGCCTCVVDGFIMIGVVFRSETHGAQGGEIRSGYGGFARGEGREVVDYEAADEDGGEGNYCVPWEAWTKCQSCAVLRVENQIAYRSSEEYREEELDNRAGLLIEAISSMWTRRKIVAVVAGIEKFEAPAGGPGGSDGEEAASPRWWC